MERYEARGEESDFIAARRQYERALAGEHDARVLTEYGYLLECHGRNELRRAADFFERAIKLDPGYDKPHFQLISAHAGLQEPEIPIAIYEQRTARSPGEVREWRFLANAQLSAHAYIQACEAIEAGLALAINDASLVALRGDAKAGMGDADGALADWRRALELEPDDIGPLYSSAVLLAREGRRQEAVDAWQAIIQWNSARGSTLHNRWPTQELGRLHMT